MTRTELKIDNLLCYLFSARDNGLSDPQIFNNIYYFYCSDDITNSKQILASHIELKKYLKELFIIKSKKTYKIF